MRVVGPLLIIIIIAVFILGPQTFFKVDETETAIVTRFGEIIGGSKMSPGLYMKTPFIDSVTYFDKRLLVFDAPPDSLLTKDKKNLEIDVYARGKITDPKIFYATLRTEVSGSNRVVDIVSSELRREIANDEQSEIISISRETIMNRVRDAVTPKLKEFGIELIDVRIKRADFPDAVADSVHKRMIAERERIANRERAEGAEYDLERRANADRTAIEIRTAAQRDAEIIKGCAEADSIKIYAGALEEDPEFYSFQRSLEAYKEYLASNTTIIGSSTDLGELFAKIRIGVNDASRIDINYTSSIIERSDTGVSSCEEVDVRRAGQKLISEKLDINNDIDVKLVSIDPKQWNDSSMGCKVDSSEEPVVVKINGFVAFFEYGGDTFEVHTNEDATMVVECLE
jgi:membrane protease subunit HflC